MSTAIRINKRNAWATRAVVYVRLIPPGAADTVHFRMHIPENAGTRSRCTHGCNYRKFAWWNTQFAFAGSARSGQTELSVTPAYDDRKFVFTGDTSTVSGKIKKHSRRSDRGRGGGCSRIERARQAQAHGVPASEGGSARTTGSAGMITGSDLFLQGDLKAPQAAFQKVTEMDPKNPDGWVNIGRAARAGRRYGPARGKC